MKTLVWSIVKFPARGSRHSWKLYELSALMNKFIQHGLHCFRIYDVELLKPTPFKIDDSMVPQSRRIELDLEAPLSSFASIFTVLNSDFFREDFVEKLSNLFNPLIQYDETSMVVIPHTLLEDTTMSGLFVDIYLNHLIDNLHVLEDNEGATS
jgi:hypothetical protein